jgi:hypothetical protein
MELFKKEASLIRENLIIPVHGMGDQTKDSSQIKKSSVSIQMCINKNIVWKKPSY